MYRILLLLVLISGCKTGRPLKNSFSEDKLLGKWKNGMSALEINDLRGKSDNLLTSYLTYTCTAQLRKDTLIFTSSENDPGGKTDFRWLILKNNDTVLSLKALNTNAERVCPDGNTINFIKESYILTKPFRLNKLVFHSSVCFGRCPVVDMQIDSAKNIQYTLNDTAYTAKMPDTLYHKIAEYLRQADLDNFTFQPKTCCDAPVQTFIIYYNGRRKYIKTMFMPEPLNKVGYELLMLPKTLPLAKTSASFNIER